MDSLRSAGGLLEATLESADNHLACALIGAAGGTVPPTISGAYKRAVLAHEAALKGMALGAVQGTIRHSWHGSLALRRYVDRGDILAVHQFEPHWLAREESGLLGWTSLATPDLRKDIANHFIQRNEDSVEVQDVDISDKNTGKPNGHSAPNMKHAFYFAQREKETVLSCLVMRLFDLLFCLDSLVL